MTARTILHAFDVYRMARMSFVQTVAESALRPQNVDVLLGANVLELLRPLLDDVCVQVQQCAATALGRLAHHGALPPGGERALLPGLLRGLGGRSRHFRRAAMFVLRATCRHGGGAAEAALAPGTGALDALLLCLGDVDAAVREAAAWAAGYAARAAPGLARALVDAGALPHLVLCLQEPELAVRRVAASALADVARHSGELAQAVQGARAVGPLARAARHRDDALRRQALLALAAVARHSQAGAEAAVQADLLPDVLLCLGQRCPLVRRNAAMLVRDVVRHSADLAQLVVNAGGLGALVEALRPEPADAAENEEPRVPAAAALGHVGGHGAPLAACAVQCGAVAALHAALRSAPAASELAAACAWALGQLARHAPQAVAASGALPELLARAEQPAASEELRARCHAALRHCVQGCTSLAALEPLLHRAPPDLLKHVLAQLTKILPGDPRARRLFVTSGGLRRVQELPAEPGSATMEYVALINACFPEEIVRYYSPGYPDLLLEKVEQFQPHLGPKGDEPPPGLVTPPPSQTASKELQILFDD